MAIDSLSMVSFDVDNSCQEPYRHHLRHPGYPDSEMNQD